MEQLLVGGPWAAIGGLIFVVIMLLRNRTKPACPIIESGGTPLTKGQHDEVCMQKWELNEEKLKHIKEGTDRIETKVDNLTLEVRKTNGGDIR